MPNTVFILLFRGVGGATQLPVARLREALTAAGFENVTTYINSGNAIVLSRFSREKTRSIVAEVCRKEFKFEKAIFVVSLAEWEKIFANNPFSRVMKVPKYVHAAVLEKQPKRAEIEKLRGYAKGEEAIEVIDQVAYLHTPDGFGTSDLAARFDKGIGVTNTARNWNTVTKLLELARRCANI